MQIKIQKAFEWAAEASKKAGTKRKDTYNTKMRGGAVRVGYRVLDGKHKSADRRKQEPYTVIGQPNGDIPVFTVQNSEDNNV
jgi:hypothetical protein